MNDRKVVDRIAGRWLKLTGSIGFVLTVSVFLLNVTGLLPGVITPEESAEVWELSSAEYADAVSVEPESCWMFRSTDGYSLSSAALALLASAALPTLLILAFTWFRRHDRLYGFMALGVSLVLFIAIIL